MGKYNIERISQLIRIGWNGENNWRPQTFDCSSLLAARPNGTVTLWILPNGESQAFPVALTADGNLRTWTPLDSELVGGGGKLQFHCQSGTDIGKSPVYRYVVEDSLLTGAEHPDETPSWAVQVVEDVTEAASHYPCIGENGNWFVWDTTEGEFVDTGVSAGGGEISPEDVAEAVEDYMDEHPVTEADPTVPAWAKQPQKPSYTASEVGALPADTVIPTVPTAVSQLDNDLGYLTLAGLDYSGANILLLSLSGATVTLDESFSHVCALLSDSARQNLFVLPIGGTELQPITLEFYLVHLDGQNYSITLACVYNGNRYSVTLDAASPNASSMTGTLVTETIVMQSDIPAAVSQLTNDSGYQTAAQVQTAIAAKYTKPSGGIPKSDLASDVQTSLGKADTALQSHQSLSGYATEQWVEGKGYLTAHQSLANYQTKAITDTGGYFTTDTVEGALQEIGAELAGVNTLIGSGVIV